MIPPIPIVASFAHRPSGLCLRVTYHFFRVNSGSTSSCISLGEYILSFSPSSQTLCAPFSLEFKASGFLCDTCPVDLNKRMS